jgi:branched-chain amino acid transport system permease protein
LETSVNLLNGISYGMILFIIASGLSIIFGVMGILNLAHGALYVIGAYIGLTLAKQGTDFFLVALAAGVAVGLLGLVLERAFLGRLYKQLNEQVLLTLGLIYIFWNVILWVWGPYTKVGVAPSILQGTLNMGDFSYPVYRLAIILIGAAIFVGLWFFQEKTRTGAIIRAGMDDKQMTVGLGINYGLFSSFIFFLGAFLGGLAGFLGTPIIGIAPWLSFDILLFALIVIVVGGVGYVQGALAGALLIGIIDSVGKAYFPDFALFIVYLAMIIILLTRPTGLLGRAQLAAGESAVKAGLPELHVPGVPTMRGRLAIYGIYALIGVIILLLPPFVSADLRNMITKVLIFGIFALSLNLLFGYAGLFSLGHAAFFGVGAYTTAILMVKYGIGSFWLLIIAGILIATICAAFFGIIALRVSGVYFLLVTLAIGQLLYSVALKWTPMTGGINGLVGITYPDIGIPGFTMTATSFYYLVFILFAICFFVLYRVVRSPFGRALQGIRGDERRMQCLGYNTWLYKYIAFVVGGLFAGIAGVLFSYQSGIVGPGSLGVLTSTIVMLMVIIGSDRVFWGPVLGAAVVVLLEHYSSIYIAERWPMILGGVFVLSVMFLRGGISIHLTRLWKKVQYRSQIQPL